MKKNKKEFALLTRKLIWKLFFDFLEKEMDPAMRSTFSSLIPACSLRFPIAATQVKAIESSYLINKLKAAAYYNVKSNSKNGQRFLGIHPGFTING